MREQIAAARVHLVVEAEHHRHRRLGPRDRTFEGLDGAHPRAHAGGQHHDLVAHAHRAGGDLAREAAVVQVRAEHVLDREAEWPFGPVAPHLDGLDEPARAESVIRYWTWKEAVLKATGDGLGIEHSKVVFSPPGRRPELVEWPGDPAAGAALVLDELALHADYLAALAVLGTLAAAPVVRRADSAL